MKNCAHCSATAPDDAEACPSCNQPFSAQGVSIHQQKRPDGSAWLTTAGFTVVAAVFCGMMGLGEPALLVVAGVLLSLAISFWAVGSIVQAIWFLPGDAYKSRQ